MKAVVVLFAAIASVSVAAQGQVFATLHSFTSTDYYKVSVKAEHGATAELASISSRSVERVSG
jgi:hypothetical protein